MNSSLVFIGVCRYMCVRCICRGVCGGVWGTAYGGSGVILRNAVSFLQDQVSLTAAELTN